MTKIISLEEAIKRIAARLGKHPTNQEAKVFADKLRKDLPGEDK